MDDDDAIEVCNHDVLLLYLPAGLFTPCQYTGAFSGCDNPLPSGYGTCELIYIFMQCIFFCIFSACIHFGLHILYLKQD